MLVGVGVKKKMRMLACCKLYCKWGPGVSLDIPLGEIEELIPPKFGGVVTHST